MLEGVFQDDHGTYPAGSWLRNPPGSVHRPWSEAGCTIWVKTGHCQPSRGPTAQKREPGVCRKASSSALDTRPRSALR